MSIPEPRAEIAQLLKSVMLRVPGATPEAILFQLEDSLREYTQESNTWLQQITMDTTPGAVDYQLVSPCQGATIMWVLSAAGEHGALGLAMQPYGFNRPYQQRERSDGTVDVGPPRTIASPSPGVIHVWPEPDGTYPIFLEVSLVAHNIDAPVPPGFFVLNHEGIMAGALYRLYASPGMPWSSTTLAGVAGKKFRSEVVKARITMDKTAVRGLQPVLPLPRPAGAIRA